MFRHRVKHVGHSLSHVLRLDPTASGGYASVGDTIGCRMYFAIEGNGKNTSLQVNDDGKIVIYDSKNNRVVREI